MKEWIAHFLGMITMHMMIRAADIYFMAISHFSKNDSVPGSINSAGGKESTVMSKETLSSIRPSSL